MDDVGAAKLAGATPVDALCDAARRLVPEIRGRALKMERAARLDDDLIDALDDAGLFSILVPRRWGGPGLGVTELYQVSEILGSADLSTAWVSIFYLMHDFLVCRFPLETQQQ